MTDYMLEALQEKAGARMSYTCSRYDEFVVADVNIPEDMHMAVIGKDSGQYVAVASDGCNFVEISPSQLRWLFMEAIERGWYDD